MATVRMTGVDTATGKERRLQSGDTIENLTISGLAMLFKGAIDGAGHPWPDEATARDNGDTYTITAGAEITDPEGVGQTVQPGDEIVWDEANGWWVVVGNADTPNVKAAILGVLTVNEDLLVRRAGDVDRLAIGAQGQVLQVDGATQAVWGGVATPLLSILTTPQDMLYRNGGAAARLPVGAPGDVLTVGAGPTVGWAAPAGGGGGGTPLMVEWWVALDGNDGTGDGSKSAPFATLQAAIVAAHAFDNSGTPSIHHHVIHIAPGDYTNAGAITTPTFFGSDDGDTDWSGDTIKTMIATVQGEGRAEYNSAASFPPTISNVPVSIGPVAIYECQVVFEDIEIRGLTHAATERPALALNGVLNPGLCGLRRCSVNAGFYGGGVEAAVWLGKWDDYSISGGGLWGVIEEANFGNAFIHEECAFENTTNAPTILSGSIAFRGSWVGRDSTIYNMTLAHGGAAQGSPALLVSGEDNLVLDWKDVNVIADLTFPAAVFLALSDARIVDCVFIGNRFSIGDFAPNGWNYILEIGVKGELFIDRNEFFCAGVGFDDTPGNCAVYLSGDSEGSPPFNVYWGTNVNKMSGLPASRMLKEAFFNISYRQEWFDNIFFTKRSVMRQIWDMDFSGAPTVKGFDCLSNSLAFGPDETKTIEVIGNGGSQAPREPLPCAIVRDKTLGVWQEQTIVSPFTAVGAGLFPLVGTDDCVSREWATSAVSATLFGSMRITDKDALGGLLRIIVPGAHLAIYTPGGGPV